MKTTVNYQEEKDMKSRQNSNLGHINSGQMLLLHWATGALAVWFSGIDTDATWYTSWYTLSMQAESVHNRDGTAA